MDRKTLINQIRNYDELEKKIREIINPEIKELSYKIKNKFQSLIDSMKSDDDAVSVLTLGIVVGNVIGDDICSVITSDIIKFDVERPELKEKLENIDEKYLPKC